MSVKTPSSLSIGSRKTENFLLRLSQLSQEKFGARIGPGYSSAPETSMENPTIYSGAPNTSFSPPNDSELLKFRHYSPSIMSGNSIEPSNRSQMSSNGEILCSNGLNENGNLLPHEDTPSYPSYPSISSKHSKVAPPKPSKPSKPPKLVVEKTWGTMPGTISQSQQLIDIQIELPTYVARKSNSDDSCFNSKEKPSIYGLGSSSVLSTTSHHSTNAKTIAPPKPQKLKAKLGDNTSKFLGNSSVEPADDSKPPTKPRKPKVLAQETTEPLKIQGNLHLEPLKSNVAHKPVLPPKSFLASQKVTSAKPLKPTACKIITSLAPGTSRLLIKPVKRAETDPESSSLLDFRATLSTVLRSQTDPNFSLKTAPAPETCQATTAPTKNSSLKLGKLTHPNKGRSKGPKRRLPKAEVKTTTKSLETTPTPQNSFPTSGRMIQPVLGHSAVPLSSLIGQTAPTNTTNTTNTPKQPRRPPPIKGKKPDFKKLSSRQSQISPSLEI